MARVVDHVAEHAAHTPDAVAVSCRGEETTYAQLTTRVNAIAHVLHQQGIGKGDYVGIMLERCAQEFPMRHARPCHGGGHFVIIGTCINARTA